MYVAIVGPKFDYSEKTSNEYNVDKHTPKEK